MLCHKKETWISSGSLPILIDKDEVLNIFFLYVMSIRFLTRSSLSVREREDSQ